MPPRLRHICCLDVACVVCVHIYFVLIVYCFVYLLPGTSSSVLDAVCVRYADLKVQMATMAAEKDGEAGMDDHWP